MERVTRNGGKVTRESYPGAEITIDRVLFSPRRMTYMFHSPPNRMLESCDGVYLVSFDCDLIMAQPTQTFKRNNKKSCTGRFYLGGLPSPGSPAKACFGEKKVAVSAVQTAFSWGAARENLLAIGP